MATIAELNVLFSADTRGLTAGLREAKKKTQRFTKRAGKELAGVGRNFRQAANQAFNLKSAIGVLAGTAGLGLLVRGQLKAVQAMTQVNNISGVQSRTLEAVALQAGKYGISQERANDALVDFSERLGEARTGTGEAVDGFKLLEQASGRQINLNQNVNKVWAEYVSALGQVDDASTRAAISAQIGGDALRDMSQVVEEGGEGFRAAADEAERMGLVIDRVDAAQIQQANSAIARIQASFEGLIRQLTVKLAPILSASADYLADMTQNGQVFGISMTDVVNNTINGISFIADAIAGVKRIFEVLGKIAAVAFLRIQEGSLAAADYIVNYPTRATNALIDVLNKVPGFDFEKSGLGDLGKKINREWIAAKRATEIGKRDIEKTLMEPLPSAGIKDFVAQARTEIQQAVTEQGPIQIGSTQDIATENGAESDRVQRIRESLATERELEQQRFEERMEWLRTASEREFEFEGERKILMEELEANHQDRLNKIREKGFSEAEKLAEKARKAKEQGWQATAGFVVGQLQMMTSGIAQESRAAFEINKAATLAQIALKTPEAMSNAFAWGNAIGGPPAGYAAAAAALAAQIGHAHAAMSTSFSGGGGGTVAPSVAGTTPATPVTPVSEQEETPEPSQRIFVEFEGRDEQQVPLRQFREQIRRIKDDNPEAELVF